MVDTNRSVDATLFYIAKSQDEFLFKDLFEKAKKTFGLETIYIVSNNGEAFDEMLIKTHVKDIAQPIYYISGPQEMVETNREMLQKMGATKIKTDLFTGYE
jgi:NAD(P)H-flavin reductase